MPWAKERRSERVVMGLGCFLRDQAFTIFLFRTHAQSPTLSVHADPDTVGFEHSGERFAGKLTILVGIENLRSTVLPEGTLRAFYAERFVQAVADTPTQTLRLVTSP